MFHCFPQFPQSYHIKCLLIVLVMKIPLANVGQPTQQIIQTLCLKKNGGDRALLVDFGHFEKKKNF